ncbi:radical SAM protein [Candidatus Parcubacteria bacterium]|nr:MAG: radical SAM protein [Candidatus Parcubacteria bacterium]
MKIAAIIKASNISKHFPNRYKTKIEDCLLLEFIVRRVRVSEFVNDIVLATTNDFLDDELVEMGRTLGLVVFRGVYDDSIGRLYGAACLVRADVIIKVFGNYPLVDPWEMDNLIKEFLESNNTYGYNEHYQGILLGLGVEIFTFDLLKKTNFEITAPFKRHIGTGLFKSNVSREDILVLTYPNRRPNYRVSLAVPQDVMIVNQIIKECDELNHDGIVQYLDNNPIIVKYAKQNISGPKEAGLEKILLFPEKIESIRQSKENSVDFSYPVSIELSLTNRCNLRCHWCSDSDLRKRSMTDIDFDVLKSLFMDLSENGVRGIVIEGGGEPTVHPRFNDIIKCAKDFNHKLGLITNGIILPDQTSLNNFDWIRVSLDAANRFQFIKAKGSDQFDTVIDNIRQMVMCGQRHNLVVGIGYVLTKYNEDHLEDLVISLCRIGVNYIQFRPVIDHSHMLPIKFDLQYLEKYSTSEFTVNIHNMNENIIKGNLGLPCLAHSLSTVISTNGDIYICGRLNKYKWLNPIGNLYKESFHDIWKGKERIRQARMVFDSEFCRKWCPECRLTKYNILLDNISKIHTKNFI